MQDRKYQDEAVESILTAYDAGTRRMLLVMATGTGKTNVFGRLFDAMRSRLSGQMLVVAHTDELVRQNAKRLQTMYPHESVGIEMGNLGANGAESIISASVQTLGRKGTSRGDNFTWNNIKTIIVDECHHSVGDAYRRIFDRSGCLDPNSGKLLLGVTATSQRSDEVSLADIFEKVVYVYPIRKAITEGYLVDIRGYRVRTDTSLAGVAKSGTDFAVGELSARIDTPLRNQQIVDAWRRLGEGRKTVVFCADIQHAKDMAEEFRGSGVSAEAVWGPPTPERAEKIARHRRGATDILCVCQLLMEGYDDPTIACIVLARPTQSPVLFSQCVGRGTRLAPSKKDLIVIDVVDGTVHHSLVTLPTLMGLPNKLDIKGRPLTEAAAFVEEMQSQNSAVDFSKLEDIDDAKTLVEKVDMFSIKFPSEVETSSELTWFKAVCGGYKMLVPKEGLGKTGLVHIYENALGVWELDGTIKDEYFHGIRPSFEEAIKVADEQIRKRVNTQTLSCVKREALWHSKKVSGGQMMMLKRLFPHRAFAFELMNSGQASRLISEKLTRRAK